MFSLIQKIFRRERSLDDLYNKLQVIVKRLDELENISDERESLWLFIEEMREQEKVAYQLLQEELGAAIVRSLEPRGEA